MCFEKFVKLEHACQRNTIKIFIHKKRGFSEGTINAVVLYPILIHTLERNIFTLMITWGSNNYFVTSPLLLVWLLSEFGINVQKQYNFTIFSNKNEKVEILEIWLILIITSLHLLYVWSEFGINVQKQYNFTIFSNNNEKLKFWKFDGF